MGNRNLYENMKLKCKWGALMVKKVKIIGAGVAGLVTGCYLQMNGYDTEILEMHNIPGGLCTSWKRGGYNFDGCIHWLLGSDKGSAFHKLWSELIDMDEIKFVNHSRRVSIEVKDNADKYGRKIFELYSNVDELEKYLLDLSPEDKGPIKEFVDSIRFVQKYELPPLVEKAPEVRNFSEKISMLKYLPLILFINKWSKISNVAFAKRFKNPFLKEAFELIYEGQEHTLLGISMQMAYFSIGCAGYPVNGSLAFAKKLEERYYKLGGKIRFNTKVNKIITENNTAAGIKTDKNEILDADLVISAADWNSTVFEALDGKYTDKVINSLKEQKVLEVFPSVFLVSIGVSRTFEDTSHLLRFPLDEVLKLVDGSEINRMEAHIYNYDRTMSPEGKTAISVTLQVSNPDFWIELREKDYARYKEMKANIAQEVIKRLDNKFGNIKNYVEVIDVATPATFLRYTGNWKGSIQGWMPSEKLFAPSPVKSTLPGLKNFYLTGQWTVPGGGLPIALMTGRNIAQIICKNDKKVFACEGKIVQDIDK
jgi:phytoene dehydrogenase-like protein